MKQKWTNPSLTEMGVENTNTPSTFDLGHLDPDRNHKHVCSCGEEFQGEDIARAHLNLMSSTGQNNNQEHQITLLLLS